MAPLPLTALLPGIVVLGAGLGFALGPAFFGLIGAITLFVAIAILVVYLIGGAQSKAAAASLGIALREARQIERASEAAAESIRTAERARLDLEFEEVSAAVAEQWLRSDTIESEFENAARKKLEDQVPRVFTKSAAMLVPRLAKIEADCTGRVANLTLESRARLRELTEIHNSEIAALETEEATRWNELVTDWKREVPPIFNEIARMKFATDAVFPPWSSAFADTWSPPMEFTAATKFGHLDLDLASFAPKDPRLALPGPAHVEIPLALTFPEQGSILFETSDSGDAAVVGALNNIVLRLLSTTPPGKLALTFLDPVGLGENFAGVMHLADYEESLVNRRIWTQREQIEERLAELSEHIEKVIQMYLRNEYASITEYNAQAGSVAEKYHFLVVADFPGQFSETAARRLQSIALAGPRCGIFTLIHWDKRHAPPDGCVPDDLRKNSVCLRRENGAFVVAGNAGAEVRQGRPNVEAKTPSATPPRLFASLILDPPPEPELAVEFVHKIGKASIDSNRVEVPFGQIAPAPDQRWTADTTSELRVAIGRTGATKHQYLAIGKGTRQHALFAGKTGSGKSTLFHVIITNLALACSPEQVEFYLIDFKKGVEFKCYATKRLPHARVIAIESDREFALSVLQRVDDELKRRGDLFRKLGVQDIAGYKKAGGTEPIPRSLLMIDEFQEFFVEDDSVAQTASLLFDRIVRQGRAFGIHVLLGSQSLGGAYSLARATIGQMVIRVALQCNEADAYLIMDDTNSAPRLLTRPGEGIYNDAGGAVEGNSPFQVVWLPDEERDQWLDKVNALARERHFPVRTPVVFEGNAPADITENDPLREALAASLAERQSAVRTPRMWLGAPNSIKGPTEAVFRRQSGNHLLIVGQREEPAVTMLGLGLLGLASQFAAGSARFFLLHQAVPETADAEFFDRILAAVRHPVTVARGSEIAGVMSELAAELQARQGGEGDLTGEALRREDDEDEGDASATAENQRSSTAPRSKDAIPPPIFLLISGLHKFKKLRHEDDFSFSSGDSDPSPGAQLNEIITDGSSHGIHIVATIDTFNNINRFMNRKALSEFEMRVVFQMSANDSASLIDSPKAGGLGLHRAIFYNEQEGTLETFRPYAPPDPAWLARPDSTSPGLPRT